MFFLFLSITVYLACKVNIPFWKVTSCKETPVSSVLNSRMIVWGHNICCVATESNSETHLGWQEEKPDLRRATALIVCHHLTQQGTPGLGTSVW